MVDLNRILSEERKNLSLIEALKLVESYGLPVARYIVLRSRDDIPSVGRIGFPLVLKVSSPKIIHKTEIGGVKIGLKSLDEVYRAYDEMIENVNKKMPGTPIDGIVAQEMVKEGYEVIIGGLNDPQFGPVIAFGLGGIFVEVIKDVAFDIAPISKEDAIKLIERTKGSRLLKGYRGRQPADLEVLSELVSRASYFIWDYREYIREVDLNPVFVLTKGAKIVDARIILK